ncbi:TetR/AcrR family transcriptional regulator [Alkalicaulis satelles]|uniref:TetR/AcrR family transcriptional regulator n=1 Tax=Alkalicaulis satelles TaxID=2609175 RepID=A0A5M6ZKI5_9PROT|nr:TetR/AcrR family transcriptional regulator [Alkalicaulis satelles]KAA5805352.1 TetR/AcrR family transcriptional regulator [Alkalicaulis satelles]
MSAMATRERILDAALQSLAEGGFEALTIGRLAARTGLSKSGLFAHFGGQEALHCAVVDAAAKRFQDAVTAPALTRRDPVERIETLAGRWLDWLSTPGLGKPCPMVQCAVSAPGLAGGAGAHAIAIRARFRPFVARLARQAAAAGRLAHITDPDQFAFEFEAIGLGAAFAGQGQDPGADLMRARQAFRTLLSGPPS